MGQIASFMESLHLSYDEVVHRLPYRNLVMMNSDKLHAVYGKKEVIHRTGKEMLNQKQYGVE